MQLIINIIHICVTKSLITPSPPPPPKKNNSQVLIALFFCNTCARALAISKVPTVSMLEAMTGIPV